MNFDQLWIGDKVFLVSKNRNAVWEGRVDAHTGRVRIDHDKMQWPLSDIKEAIEEKKEHHISMDNESDRKPIISDKGYEIDLHIEKLNPSLKHEKPELILNYQTRRCKEFIEYALSSYKSSVLIIHGKGEGALKREVLHMIEDYPEVQHIIEKNDGGAVEVWFSYQ